MAKSKVLSKFNFKNYNNELEAVLEKKAFSEDVKNLLLSMLYKIEVSYKDYKTVKQDVTPKENFIESIIYTIENDCEKIEFVRPKENDKLNFEIVLSEKKIICYQNEISLFEALVSMSKKYFLIDNSFDYITLPLQELLSKGYEEDKIEVITDFDGWSWNYNKSRIHDEVYNFCYQILRITMGNNFLYEWKRDRRKKIDYLLTLKEHSEELYFSIYKMSLLLFGKNAKQKKQILETKQKFVAELTKMEDKKEYLKQIYARKKQINNNIKLYDKTINNREKLLEEFNNRNEKLPDAKKIFSISDLVDVLQKEREENINLLREITAMALPKNYVEKINSLKGKIDLINSVQNVFSTKKGLIEEILNTKIEMQRIFLAYLENKIYEIKTKKEALEMIYVFRYYKCLSENCLGNNIILYDIENKIIAKAISLKTLTCFCKDIEYNSKIIGKIINNSIIEVENLKLILRKTADNSKLEIEIYDDETFDRKEYLELEPEKEFNTKFGKKIKLIE